MGAVMRVAQSVLWLQEVKHVFELEDQVGVGGRLHHQKNDKEKKL